ILACIKRLLRETLPDSDSVKSIEVLETLERFMQREGIRDHFLHSFQVFLLGCIILDYHYGKFSAWYSNCFGGSSSVKIEDTWLLASLLHDAKYPFQNISKWSGLGPGTGYAIKLETPRRRAQLLGSLFQHSRRMKTKNTWHSDLVDRLRNPDIEKIAIAQVSPSSPNLPNHAAISSFSLLAKESILPPVIFCQEICPAALAIFLHDSAVWSDMTKAGNLLPLEMKQFPLAFLLIYCDGLQEWGRRSGNDPQGKNSCLLDLKIDEKSVTTRIWFNDPANAIMMEVQHARILNEIVVPSEIDFKCEVNITSPVATKPIR
ncbi:MAG TPA: hypothetical protein VE862_02770, partial [Candidatus Acidoferrum sp.]|nr:hypothetical protein [Candidatus Acidoferrum sp.]